MALVYIPSTTADQSMGPRPVSFPLITIEAMNKAKYLLMNMQHRFTGLISPTCD
jgi:hypothetical protein